MLGRGAVSDPHLFERIRGRAPTRPTGDLRRHEVAAHIERLLHAFDAIFCGDAQVISKLKETLAHVEDDELKRWKKQLKKQRQLSRWLDMLRDAQAPG